MNLELPWLTLEVCLDLGWLLKGFCLVCGVSLSCFLGWFCWIFFSFFWGGGAHFLGGGVLFHISFPISRVFYTFDLPICPAFSLPIHLCLGTTCCCRMWINLIFKPHKVIIPFCKMLFGTHLKSARTGYVRLEKRLNEDWLNNIQLHEGLVGEVKIWTCFHCCIQI